MGKPTHDDAMVMLNLLQWSAQANHQDAVRFIWSDKFLEDHKAFIEKYPRGTKEFGYAVMECGWFETIGALWKHDLFSEELLFDWILIRPTWERLKGFVLGQREAIGEEKLYEFFEALAKKQN